MDMKQIDTTNTTTTTTMGALWIDTWGDALHIGDAISYARTPRIASHGTITGIDAATGNPVVTVSLVLSEDTETITVDASRLTTREMGPRP